LAEKASNPQGPAAALAGLACVRAADDLVEASQIADRAVSLGGEPHQIDTLPAQRRITIMQGDTATAQARAATALNLAHQRNEAGSAEARELSAYGGSTSATADLTDVAGFCRRPVKIHALGVFRVLRDDTVVPATKWKSKKARDLLKIIVSRRGRTMTREEIIGLLWPEDDSAKVSNRLSVLLSTLRSVLNESSDSTDASTALVTDRFTVRLDIERVEVDVECFVSRSTTALRAWQRQNPEAVALLEQAKAAYSGDFCEEDVYEDWAIPLREELRTAHLSVLRALAAASREAGHLDPAVQGLLSVLRHDPYDEHAHLELVGMLHSAGRYGDARRYYTTYRNRMTEIAIKPSPFPAHA
jgi:DNA-binding SARP family transcriptional activator